MVFFTCDKCNESLKKNQVEKHCFKCRGCESVTCIDCSVTFYGDDYKTHLVCISESEKYEKSLYKGKQKQSPQDIWMESIQEAIASQSKAPKSIQQYLAQLGDFGNIPRNRNKFNNFLKNSLKLHSTTIADELWGWINLANQKAPHPSATIESVESVTVEKCIPNGEENTESLDGKIQKKEKKRKREREEVEPGISLTLPYCPTCYNMIEYRKYSKR